VLLNERLLAHEAAAEAALAQAPAATGQAPAAGPEAGAGREAEVRGSGPRDPG
jgi:hypothetical protein